MFDLAALEAAGFTKTLSDEEWQQLQDSLRDQYARPGATVGEFAGGNVRVDYVLQSGAVRIFTEQNTQEQSPFGISTTVHYPEIVVVENLDDGRRVACDAHNTALILELATQLKEPQRRAFGREALNSNTRPGV